MNVKNTAPLLMPLAPSIIAIVPPLLALGLLCLALKWLDSDDDEAQPKTLPVEAEAETCRKEAETMIFRQIPRKKRVKRAVIPPLSAPEAEAAPLPPALLKPAVPLLAPAAVVVLESKTAEQVPPAAPIKKKFVTREDMAVIFQSGARMLNRTDAVAAFKQLGFGKTAAYAALSPDGRFATWLNYEPDGIISWIEANMT